MPARSAAQRDKTAELSRTDRRRARTRQALLSAAEQLLASRPAEAVNVDQIAELADVAKGTIYNYFADKDALLREVESSARNDLEQTIGRANSDQSDPARRIAGAFAAALNWALADPAKARTVQRMSPHFADPETPINAGVRRDVHMGYTSGRFSLASDEAGLVVVMSVVSGGMNRALDLMHKSEVRRLGESLAAILLTALGVEREEADRIARDAMKQIR